LISLQSFVLHSQQQFNSIFLIGICIVVFILLIIISFSAYFFKKKQEIEKKVILNQNEQYMQLLRLSIEQEETERHRIAKDLHDDIGSLLFSAGMKLNFISKKIDDPEHSKKIDDVNTMIDESVAKIRNLSKSIAPPLLNEFGLVRACEGLSQMLFKNSSLKMNVIGSQTRIHYVREILLFRIIQEFINNSIKHGNPNFIEVEFGEKDKFLFIKITENGIPFNLKNAISKDETSSIGNGLRNIKTRLENCKAELEYSFIDGKNHNTIYYKLD
jgi:two-component system NarL family sensor kinase